MKILLFFIILFFSCSDSFALSPQEQIFLLINQQRVANGLPKLKYNNKLEKAAQFHANWMAKVDKMEHLQDHLPTSYLEYRNSTHHSVNRIIKSGYFEFEDAFDVINYNNRMLVRKKIYADRMQGEVIARGENVRFMSYEKQIQVIVPGWMRSPGHKKEILSNYKEMGVGYAIKNRNSYWCVNFGNLDFIEN